VTPTDFKQDSPAIPIGGEAVKRAKMVSSIDDFATVPIYQWSEAASVFGIEIEGSPAVAVDMVFIQPSNSAPLGSTVVGLTCTTSDMAALVFDREARDGSPVMAIGCSSARRLSIGDGDAVLAANNGEGTMAIREGVVVLGVTIGVCQQGI
jgi:hypothetical protein